MIPIEVLILGAVITLLSLLDRLLKLTTNKTALQHIKKRIQKSKEKAVSIRSASFKESYTGSMMDVDFDISEREDWAEMVDDLVDLTETLIFAYSH